MNYTGRWRHELKLTFRVWPRDARAMKLALAGEEWSGDGMTYNRNEHLEVVHRIGLKGFAPFELSDADAMTLAAVGAASLAVGWALVPMGVPMIKQIFTASFTLQAIGWCMLALAALYALTDILKFRRGLGLVILFGQFALAAYLMHTLFAATTRTFASTLVQGMPRFFGASAQPFVLALAESATLIVALFLWRKVKRGS